MSIITTGQNVSLIAKHPLHYGVQSAKSEKTEVSFFNMLKNQLKTSNDIQNAPNQLMDKMIHEPGSVDIHEVMIAAQKAEIALGLTKSVRDEAIRAFRDLMSLR